MATVRVEGEHTAIKFNQDVTCITKIHKLGRCERMRIDRRERDRLWVCIFLDMNQLRLWFRLTFCLLVLMLSHSSGTAE